MTMRVLELHQQQIEHLSNQMLVSIFTLLIILRWFFFKANFYEKDFTMDVWTDLNMKAYMAVTAHWLQKASLQPFESSQSKLTLCSDLIGFIHISGSHTGECLAEVFVYILDCIKLGNSKKVHFIQ